MVLGQFSDICAPQILENWPRTIRATVPQLINMYILHLLINSEIQTSNIIQD